MEREKIYERVLEVLQGLHEDIDFEVEEKLVTDKILDSFDLVSLVTELGEEFDVEITARDFVEKNFNSAKRLTDMVLRLMEE